MILRQLRRPFVSGMIAGIALVFLLRVFINQTTLADRIVAPLLMTDTASVSDAVVVLGAGVIEGCVPNQNGVRRVLHGVRLWKEKKAPIILFTGGAGRGCPVATAMARLAREIGVPDRAIREEVASTSTWENGAMSAPLLRGWGMTRVLLVSDRLHLRRASAVFTRLGFDVSVAAVPIAEGHDDNVAMLRAGLREFAALAFYRVRGWIGPPPAATAGAPARAAGNRPAHAPSDRPLVLFGASYVKGWNLPSVGGVPIVNRGAGGELTSDMLARFDRDVVDERPQAVLLWGFINDVFKAAPAEVEPELSRTRERYVEMIARARRHGIVPMLATELPVRPPASSRLEPLLEVLGAIRGKDAYQDTINRHVAAMNTWVIETAAREQLLLLNLGDVLSEPGGRRHPAFAQPDGSHVSAAGYETLTTFAVPILEEFFVGR